MLTREKFDELISSQSDNINTYIETIELNSEIENTKTTTYIHCLKLCGRKLPRVNDFAKYLSHRVINYAIPKTDIRTAQLKDIEECGSANIMKLREKAVSLFTNLKTSGEGGELLLYILVEEFLKIPQLICKMPLKTNGQVHYHCVDGIHCTLGDTGNLELYWGESKLHQTYGQAIKECFISLNNFLQNSPSTDRDIELIHDNLDLIDADFQTALVNYFDKDHPNYNSMNYNGIALVGFDFNKYPTTPNSGDLDAIINEINLKLLIWKAKVKEQVEEHQCLNTFKIHLFILPFPSVQEFRDYFLKELGIR